MSDWRARATALAERLAALDGVDPQWSRAFAEVPRHVFVPRFYPDLDAPEAIDSADPHRQWKWFEEVYSDESLVTQYRLTPGTTDLRQSTSSSTRPSLMARMLTLLDIHDSHRVLEIGTGTGYNAAPSVGQIWTSARDGSTLIRVSGDGGTWAELNPTTGTVTQGGPADLFDDIEHAAKQWDQLDHPDPGRFGITAGPVGHIIWLDSPQHPIL
jgi:hypothetical protein